MNKSIYKNPIIYKKGGYKDVFFGINKPTQNNSPKLFETTLFQF
jgi:hypothetical protein